MTESFMFPITQVILMIEDLLQVILMQTVGNPQGLRLIKPGFLSEGEILNVTQAPFQGFKTF